MKTLDREGRSDLHYAARDGNLAEVELLLAQGADVNLQDKQGWAPLHFAAQASSVDVARYLVKHGATVDLEDTFGNTPLARATFASKGDGSVIRALRDAGADPMRKNKHGVSEVSLARSVANHDVAQYFKDLENA
jgi:uncharacterized protein